MSNSLDPKARALVCFDFDLTLTDAHLFRSVTEMIRSGASRERACMKAISYLDERGARGGARLWELIGALLMRGHGLAVCSFTAYPELAMALLQRGVRGARGGRGGKDPPRVHPRTPALANSILRPGPPT